MPMNEYSKIKGANYVPSYARNDIEIWRKYDQSYIERELGYARSLGLNSVRIFLNYKVYTDDKKLMLNRIDNFLSLCEKNKLRAMLVLFDACFEYPNLGELADRFGKDKKCKEFFQQWSRAMGMENRVNELFNLWPPNPGFKYLGKEFWKEEEEYVRDIVKAHQGDSRIVLYDIMNEPDSLFSFPGKKEPYLTFLEHFCSYVKGLQDEISITIGIAAPERISLVHSWEDVLSFHTYEANPEKFKELVRMFKRKSEEYQKPFIVSEWGNSIYSLPKSITDEEQLNYYQTIMPLMEEEEIGWYFWGLVVGNDPFAYQTIFYPDGQRRPAGSFIEELLQRGK